MTPNQQIENNSYNSPAASDNQPTNSQESPRNNSEKSDSNPDSPKTPISKKDYDFIRKNNPIFSNNQSDSGDGTPTNTPRRTPVNLVDSVDTYVERDEAGAKECATDPHGTDNEIPEIDHFNLEEYVIGLTAGMNLRDASTDLINQLRDNEYKFDTENQQQMQMNIMENDSDKLHIALGQLINTQEGLQESIAGCDVSPEMEGGCQFAEIQAMLSKVLYTLKRKQIIIDIREKSIEIDGIEVWSTVQRFVNNCANKQWYVNGKALGQFAKKLSKNVKKKENDNAGMDETVSENSTSPPQNCTTFNNESNESNEDNENFNKGCTPQ